MNMHSLKWRKSTWRCCLALVLLTGAATMVRAQQPAAPTAWETSPYRIKLLVAVAPGANLPGVSEEGLRMDLADRAKAVVGGSWRLEALPAPAGLRHRILNSISAVPEGGLPAELLDADKLILLGVRSTDGGVQIQARELDVVTRLWNATVTVHASQALNLRQEAFRAVLAAFAPLARIESTEGETATIRLRAAALARRDKALQAVAPGVAFRPVLVPSDTEGMVTSGKAELVPWTYLAPTTTAGSLVTCRVLTGLSGSAIPDYHPQRQRWALGVSPSSESTRLKLVSQGESARPLEGYEVQAQRAAAQEGQPAALVLVGRSDPKGIVVVDPGTQAVRMLVIRRGEETLASLPLAVGLAPEVTLALATATGRFEIETAIQEVQDGLIDLVAKREVLAARIRGAAASGDKAGGAQLLQKLRDTAPADALSAKLDQEQQALQTAGLDAASPLGAKLADMRKLLDAFQAESPADKLEAELKAAPAKPAAP